MYIPMNPRILVFDLVSCVFNHQFFVHHFGHMSAPIRHGETRQLEFLLHQLSRSAGDGDSDGEDIHRPF